MLLPDPNAKAGVGALRTKAAHGTRQSVGLSTDTFRHRVATHAAGEGRKNGSELLVQTQQFLGWNLISQFTSRVTHQDTEIYGATMGKEWLFARSTSQPPGQINVEVLSRPTPQEPSRVAGCCIRGALFSLIRSAINVYVWVSSNRGG